MAIRAATYLRKWRALKAIRAFCLSCQGESPEAVAGCYSSVHCPLMIYRQGRKPRDRQAQGQRELDKIAELKGKQEFFIKPERYLKKWSPLTAIKAQCAMCIGDRESKAENCRPQELCPVYLYRQGRKSKDWKAEARAELDRIKAGEGKPPELAETKKPQLVKTGV